MWMGMLLFLHVLGAVLFLGNIVTAAFWKVRAHYGKQDLMTIHLTVKNIMLADYVFTVPGILLLLIPGHMMAFQLGYSLGEWNWVTASLVLFSLSGVLWLAILLPLQRRMIRYSEESLRLGEQTAAYRQVSRKWDIYGTIGTILPLISLILMIWKPGM
ncbi:putative membrane protein [Paenibacillus sp. V4I5]|nr:putative membrane protein [Paenibacillus sp. V4I5]